MTTVEGFVVILISIVMPCIYILFAVLFLKSTSAFSGPNGVTTPLIKTVNLPAVPPPEEAENPQVI